MLSKVKPIQYILFAIWVTLLGTGFWKLFVYSNTPGTSAAAHTHWPVSTLIERNPQLPTLLIFAHPHCPCSEATIGELERLLPHIDGKTKSIVVFFKPKNKSEKWAKEKLWKKAQAISNVQAILDEDGVEAIRFGARTSGQTFLYDKDGNLIFQGGITPERGHMGDSDGRAAILSFISTGDIKISSTPVFGCSIRGPERAPAGKLK